MNVIVYGTKKCGETRKAERYLSERRVEYQFRDVAASPPTVNELRNMASGKNPLDLLDTGSKRYISRGLAFMEFDPIEEIAADPLLLATPVVRIGRKYFVRPALADLPLE